MLAIKNWWEQFAGEHPKAAKWVREGGLFVVVCNLITVLKYFILQFLPYAFRNLADVEFGWPGIPITLFGKTFDHDPTERASNKPIIYGDYYLIEAILRLKGNGISLW